ncbi:hypothetical protein AgCh_031417 [Apium graveolens]
MVRSTTRGRIGRSLPERRRLELIKNYDWEILYHSGNANMVADALSKKERLKMIMSFGKFIRDFEKMEIVVKERKADDHCYLLEAIWIDLNLNKDAIMKLGKAKEVADTLKDEVVERKMLGPAVVQRTRDIIDLIRGRQKGLMRFGKKGKLSPPIVGPLDILRSIGKLAYELALPQNM